MGFSDDESWGCGVRFLKVTCIGVAAWLLYRWVNESCASPLAFVDLLPFGKSRYHSFLYNYVSLGMMGIAAWGLFWRSYGKR